MRPALRIVGCRWRGRSPDWRGQAAQQCTCLKAVQLTPRRCATHSHAGWCALGRRVRPCLMLVSVPVCGSTPDTLASSTFVDACGAAPACPAARGCKSTCQSCTTRSPTCWPRTRCPRRASPSGAASRSATRARPTPRARRRATLPAATTRRAWALAAPPMLRLPRPRLLPAPSSPPTSGRAGGPALHSSLGAWGWATTQTTGSAAAKQQARQ